MQLRSIFSIVSCFIVCTINAQEQSNIKFGKITAADFKQKVYSIDSNANAIVIADIGSTEIVGNLKGSFSLEFKRFKRIHILNKNAYPDAKVEIGIYTKGEQEETLNNLKAVTYNLENGQVVETKLDTRSEVFKDRINKNLVIKKFTFPNLKEGSIIEFQYQLNSDFIFNLQPWEFQGNFPTLWSEYNVAMPEFYKYISLAQGYQAFYLKDSKERTDNFKLSDPNGVEATQYYDFRASVTEYRWVMKDVPALHEESFTTTLTNHISRIEFQLAAMAAPFTPKDFMGTWFDAADDLLKDEDFGYSLKRDNPWLNDVMPAAKKGASTPLEMAQNIFAYVRDNMTCTNHNRKYLEHPLKAVLKAKSGSEAEINLLLTAMLVKAGLTADPVILSTRSNGYTYAIYPLLNRFNYVITKLQIAGKDYYLDASHPMLGFNRLTQDIYNVAYDGYSGHARVIDKGATPMDFMTDSVLENSVASVIIINSENGNLLGRMNKNVGYNESYSMRNSIKERGKEDYFNTIKKSFSTDVVIENQQIDSLEKYDDPVSFGYDFTLANNKEDIIYINPLLSESWRENPFKSAIRHYPVEMPFKMDLVYLLRMEVPTGYTVDELPKSIMLKLNENDNSFFEYVFSHSDDVISLRSRLKIDRTIYMPDEYENLREFFNLIVKKQSEQIVFKKKK